MAVKRPHRRGRYLPAAEADLRRLREDNPRLALRAVALVELVVEREVTGEPLRLLPSYGDLTDCRKIYFGVTDNATHRIVYRELPDGGVEIVEVIAIEQREAGYVYLLAAQRLGRLPVESTSRLSRVHQGVISRRSERRGKNS